jgi:hypothetical protein
MRTSGHPEVVADITRALPGLRRHRCECGSNHGFERELEDTELPHMLEHVALELMVLAGSPRTLEGRTTWDFQRDGAGVFDVAIEYDDDLVALAAVREGTLLVNAALGGDELPDVGAIAKELCALREVPAD